MSFLKTTFATVLGFFIAMFLLFILMVAFVASSSSESEPYIRNGSVLNINVSGIITERKSEDPFAEIFNPNLANAITMQAFRENIEKAKSDSRIAGIRLNLANVGGSWANLTEIRDLLKDFKSEGKFIYGYIDDRGINEAAYYIATVADSIFAQPETYFEMDGFYVQAQFYKSTFDRFGLTADVIAAGSYKDAGNTYRYDGFTDASREQIGEILNHWVNDFVTAVSEYSGHPHSEINAIMNSAPNIMINQALERGFIDALKYPHEFDDFLKEKTQSSRLNDVNFGRYSRVKPRSAGLPRESGKEIAVLYANGPIMPDFGSDIFSAGAEMITFSRFKKELDKLVENNDVAAIVIRIESPGGAVTTSEIVKNLISEASKKKPVVASMGAVAASGGYYIAMGADTVVAQNASITGSIGVVLTKISYGGLLDKQLSIKTDQIKTHRNADWFAPERPLTAEQRRALEQMADETYDSFLQLVADARGMDKQQVHRVAQGRVWTGEAALEVGLVDVLGTLPDAIVLAAEMAGEEIFKVGYYPTPKTFFETLMESGNVRIKSIVQNALGIEQPFDQVLRDINTLNRPQLFSILPFNFSVN